MAIHRFVVVGRAVIEGDNLTRGEALEIAAHAEVPWQSIEIEDRHIAERQLATRHKMWGWTNTALGSAAAAGVVATHLF